MSDEPRRLDYAGRLPAIEPEARFTLAEHAALSGTFVVVAAAIAGPVAATLAALWPFAGGIWAIAGRGGRSVPGWIGAAIGGTVICLTLARELLWSRI